MFIALVAFIIVLTMITDPRTAGCLNEIKDDFSLHDSAYTSDGSLQQPEEYSYRPASSEEFVFKNMKAFGFDSPKNPPTCPAIEHPKVKPSIDQYKEELKRYYQLIQDFEPINDLRKHLDRKNHSVCDKLDLVPGGLEKIFQSQQISWTPSGYVEPLLPPFRHLDFCRSPGRRALFDMTYLVHDFGHMCRKLKKSSQIVLIDMGASLQFHGSMMAPPVYLTSIFQKMGFKFDHIYAYETTPTKPAAVFKLVPESLQAAYHWINIGVSSEVGAKDNPLTLLLREYSEDDLIVVKLDIDTSFIETPLAHQILNDDRFAKLIDHFYFEHHVHMKELAPNWMKSMNGTVEESLKLFSGLRRKGISAHYWP